MKKSNFYRAVCAPEDPSLLEEMMVFHHLHALKSSHDIGQKATSSVHHKKLRARARVSQFTFFREITFLHRDPIFVWVPVGAVTENLRKTRGSRELFGCTHCTAMVNGRGFSNYLQFSLSVGISFPVGRLHTPTGMIPRDRRFSNIVPFYLSVGIYFPVGQSHPLTHCTTMVNGRRFSNNLQFSISVGMSFPVGRSHTSLHCNGQRSRFQ